MFYICQLKVRRRRRRRSAILSGIRVKGYARKQVCAGGALVRRGLAVAGAETVFWGRWGEEEESTISFPCPVVYKTTTLLVL